MYMSEKPCQLQILKQLTGRRRWDSFPPPQSNLGDWSWYVDHGVSCLNET